MLIGETKTQSYDLLIEDLMIVPVLRSFLLDMGFDSIRDDDELFFLRLGSTLETAHVGDLPF